MRSERDTGEGGVDRRLCIAGLLTVAAAPRPCAAHFDALVGDVPAATGGRRFDTLHQALAAAPAGRRPYRILLGAGRFDGPFTIERDSVELAGLGAGRTVLTAAAGAGEIAPDGKPYGTFRTGTLVVRSSDVRLRDLRIVNAYDAPAEMRRPNGLKADKGGSQQAIALSIEGHAADRIVVSDCAIESHQDTLYCAAGRALFVRCLVTGSYDFIFGGAAARFDDCEIRSRPRIEPVEGYIAAPSTMIDQPAGLVFDRCRLTAEPGVPAGSVYLGRPWRLSTTVDGRQIGDLRSVGMAAYLHCRMGAHIAPTGWTRMWYTGRDGNPMTMFEPEQARFREYRNIGPGAHGVRRGTTLTPGEAASLSRAAMFGTWRPAA